MKADILARRLLGYRNEDGKYDDVLVRDNKLIVAWEDGEEYHVLLENNFSKSGKIKKGKADELMELAKYYGSDCANTARDLNNFSAEVIELLERNDENE